MYDRILYEVGEGIATVTLNRPEKLNAYTPEMGEEVVAAFGRARDDDAARVVILTGAGRGFCAGVDLDYMKAAFAGKAPAGAPKLGEEAFVRQFPQDLLDFPKPVIAAINGAAIGVGVTMTLACDIRIAASGAKLALNFAKLGILPGLGSSYLLPSLVGISRALDLVLSARTVLAEEAAQIGLVQDVVPGDSLIAEARARAAAMAECKPDVLRAAKHLLRAGVSGTMADAMRNERERGAELRAQRK